MTNDICETDFKRRTVRADARRVAAHDGSHGFQPTKKRAPCFTRRGATGDAGGWVTMRFMRRSATHHVWQTANRGLKPTATIKESLRDREAAALAKKIQKYKSTRTKSTKKYKDMHCRSRFDRFLFRIRGELRFIVEVKCAL